MNAPTDLWYQSLTQLFPAEMQGVVMALVLAVIFFMVFSMLVLSAILLEQRHKRIKREDWDKQLKKSQRQERRPAHWGHYR